MRVLLVVAALLVLATVGFAGFRLWQARQVFPKPSTEVVQLTPEKRERLTRLKAEAKFEPNDYPPLGYTGPETPEEKARAIAAVDRVIDAVLDEPGRTVKAQAASAAIGKGLRTLDPLPTEDRDRAQGYMLEIWYILGFKGPTGRFAYGSAYPKPPGYGEPLPPGWTAPDRPRPIG